MSFILLLVAPAMASAQELVALSLAEAQDYAVKNSFSAKGARYDARSAELQTDQLIGIGLPQVNGSVQYQNYIDLPTSIVPGDFVGAPGQDLRLKFGMPQQMTAGISASQLLFDGSWLVGLQASKAYSRLKSQEVKKTESDVRKEVAEAYHLALIADKNVILLEEGRTLLSNTLRDTEALLKEGFVEEQDVDQLRLSLNDWNNRIANAKAQARLSRDLLKFTIGMPLNTEIELKDNSDILLSTATSDLLSTPFSPEQNISYQIAQSGLGMQQLNLRNERAKLLPNLGAFYNLQSQALRREFNFQDTSQPWFPIQLWGVQLNVPILAGGSKMKSIQKARVEVDRMNDAVILAKEGALLEYNSAKIEYENSLAVYQTSLESYSLAQRILERSQIKFREGVTSSFEVLQNTSQTLQAQGTYIQSMLSLMNAKIRLQKSLNQF